MLLLLPFTSNVSGLAIRERRLGRRSVPYPDRSYGDDGEGSLRDCIVLFPTNGVGFGHFTRMYALAKRLQKTLP